MKDETSSTLVLCDGCIREGATLAPELMENFTIVRTEDKKNCEFCRFAAEQGRDRPLNEEELEEAERMRKRGEL